MNTFDNRADVRQKKDGVWYQLDDYLEQLKMVGNTNRNLFLADTQGRNHLKEYLQDILELVNIHDEIIKEKK